MKIKIRLSANNKTAFVFLREPSLVGGLWWISDKQEQRIYTKLGLTPYSPNPDTDYSFLVRNADGYPINYYRSK
jgi:hypothetical protein